MAAAQRIEKSLERVRAPASRVAETFHPGLETLRLRDAQGVVRAEGGKDLDLPAGFGDGLVVFEGIGGIICRAYYLHVHALDQAAGGPARLASRRLASSQTAGAVLSSSRVSMPK
jgi:hypothetical protein